jgi:hypothetical protein
VPAPSATRRRPPADNRLIASAHAARKGASSAAAPLASAGTSAGGCGQNATVEITSAG